MPWRRQDWVMVVQQQALQVYLPGLYKQALVSGLDMGTVIEGCVADSPETEPTTLWNAIDPERLYLCYQWILNQVAQVSSCEVEIDVSMTIRDVLRGNLAKDGFEGRLPTASGQVSIHSQRMFRAFADVSCAAHSHQMGRVLHGFFVENVAYIASHNSSTSLAQWCYAIRQAEMSLEMHADCLRKLLRLRPDLPEKVRSLPGPKAQSVFQDLTWVGASLDTDDLAPLRRDRLDLDDLAYRRRVRSPSHGVREDEVLRQAKRMIQANEEAADHGKRMLQLAMGRRYERDLDKQLLLGYDGSGDDIASTVSEDGMFNVFRRQEQKQKIRQLPP